MTITTVAIGAAVTPTVIETWCSHYLNRKPRRQKPTAHVSYDVGLNLIRRFLTFAATQTVDDVQAFTSQWVPAPSWVRTRNVDIPDSFLDEAATHLQTQLGPEGLRLVGGKLWWQWRPKDHSLRAEWIEMKKDFNQREKSHAECKRCLFYIHGGAYYFGSVDEHRYQIQRHARKLQAKVMAPRYRLAPQYPFPCGLQDCLAAYKYLLTIQSPETIVLAGDSAGGGMTMSLLIVIRDQGLPMPAGAILLSPWVDLTHSFPSCASDNELDYVPSCGFMHKPSVSWPPPNSDGMKTLDDLVIETDSGNRIAAKDLRRRAEAQAGKLKDLNNTAAAGTATVSDSVTAESENPTPGFGDTLSIVIDDKTVEIKDQIQMYANNALISHPLVSPVLEASLGGLPPLCILVGGGEMLRDEQIYLAHKAANPAAFPPPSTVDREVTNASARGSISAALDPAQIREQIAKYPPTYVQLQVWDDMCHVGPTLSFTRPAKYMYRSVAQFGAWALARAQKSEIRILDDDEISNISTDTDSEEEEDESTTTDHKSDSKANDDASSKHPTRSATRRPNTPKSVGRAGDPLPLFKEHMIRHRVTRHGDLYPLEPATELAACRMSPHNIGNIKTGPVKKWLAAQEQLARRFGDLKQDMQKKRLGELAETIGGKGAVFADGKEHNIMLGDEQPPPTAWASRTPAQYKEAMRSRSKRRISRGLAMWSGWGSRHDEEAIEKEEDKIKNKEDVTMSVTQVRARYSVDLFSRSGTFPTASGAAVEDGTLTTKETVPAPQSQTGGTAGPATADQPSSTAGTVAGAGAAALGTTAATTGASRLEPVISSQYPTVSNPGPEAAPATAPFKLARPIGHNPSTVTLMSADGTMAPISPKDAAGRPSVAGSSVLSNGDGSKHNSLTVPASVLGKADDISRPSTAMSSVTDVQLVSAQAVPLQTAAEARRDHARKSMSGADALVAGTGAEQEKPSSWAAGVIQEVKNIGGTG